MEHWLLICVSTGEVISGLCVVNMLVVDGVVIIVSRSPCSTHPSISYKLSPFMH